MSYSIHTTTGTAILKASGGLTASKKLPAVIMCRAKQGIAHLLNKEFYSIHFYTH